MQSFGAKTYPTSRSSERSRVRSGRRLAWSWRYVFVFSWSFERVVSVCRSREIQNRSFSPYSCVCVFMADVYILSSHVPRTTTLKRLCIKGVRVLLPPVRIETRDVGEFLQNVRDFFCTRDACLLRDRQSREADDGESRRKRRSASEYPRSFRFSKLSLSHLERYAGFESRDRAP